jgi:hypothetical protein
MSECRVGVKHMVLRAIGCPVIGFSSTLPVSQDVLQPVHLVESSPPIIHSCHL